jgi:hypothetical protein
VRFVVAHRENPEHTDATRSFLMSVAIQINCLENHADEAGLITEGHNFKLIQRGKGPGRIEMRFEGRRPSMGLENFIEALQKRLRDQCLDPIEVTVVPANDQVLID